MAMSDHNRQNGDEALLVRFFDKPIQDQAASDEAGRPIFKEKPHIEIRIAGDRDVRIKPANEMHQQRFPKQWAAYQTRATEGEELEGTLMEHWPAVTRSQVEELRFMGVRTVEQLVAMPDANAQGFMGINVLRERAKKYLEASADQAAADRMIAMERRNEELTAALEEMSARLDAAEKPKATRKPRAVKATDDTADAE